MTELDLQRLESAIGRALSPAVRDFFLNYPPELRTTIREMGSGDEGDEPYTECPADQELCGDSEQLVEMNTPGRSYLLPVDWNPSMLIVGQGGCGETYWVSLDDQSGAVHRFEAGQEAQYSERIAESLEEFGRALIQYYKAS